MIRKPSHKQYSQPSQPYLDSYESAFAFYAPLMRERWVDQPDDVCARASFDIYETLVLHPHPSPYTGKLYAELDAIRDVMQHNRAKRDGLCKARR